LTDHINLLAADPALSSAVGSVDPGPTHPVTGGSNTSVGADNPVGTHSRTRVYDQPLHTGTAGPSHGRGGAPVRRTDRRIFRNSHRMSTRAKRPIDVGDVDGLSNGADSCMFNLLSHSIH